VLKAASLHKCARQLHYPELLSHQRLLHGLKAEGNDWISQHRYFGEETDSGKGYMDATGTSDQSFRKMFKAWKSYMAGKDGGYMTKQEQNI
jgi:hypothetical protein